MTDELFDRVASASAGEVALAVGVGLGTFALSLAVTAFFVVRLPSDYFTTERRPLPLAGRAQALRVAVRVGKNLFGLVLVVLGVALSLPGIPGQGILTILIGIMLVDVPGKRRLEVALVRRRAVHRSMNRLRSRFGRPPLVVPES